MSYRRYNDRDRRGYDDYRDRRWSGGDRYDGGRYGGSGGRRDRSGGRKQEARRGNRKDSRDQKRQGDKGVKRRAENISASNPKRLKGGNNWDGDDRHSLMPGKTMESKPENFENDWVFVVRPPGRRRIVVAANNVTQSYNNISHPDMKFDSCLPSGNVLKDAMFKQQDLTILDAIYSPEKKRFYVIDMVHWRHYPYYETEADFRFFCLEDKWAQLEKPEETSRFNDYPLQLLHKYPCTPEKIQEALGNFGEKIDNILFIKKDSLYSTTETPSCLKMTLDKLHEILGIDIPVGVEYIPSTKSKDAEKKEDNESNDKKSDEKSKDHESKDSSEKSPDSDKVADDKDNGNEEEKPDNNDNNMDDTSN